LYTDPDGEPFAVRTPLQYREPSNTAGLTRPEPSDLQMFIELLRTNRSADIPAATRHGLWQRIRGADPAYRARFARHEQTTGAAVSILPSGNAEMFKKRKTCTKHVQPAM